MENIQEIVDAAVAAALLAQANVNANQAQELAGNRPPIANNFARTPALANVGVLNYSTNEGMKIYNAAVAGLSTKYNGNTSDMHIFLKNIKERGQSFGWHRILEIPKGGDTFNLIDQYGLVSLSEIQDHANVYEAANGRDAQNSSQMYNFIYASITDEAKLMVLSDFADYTLVINGIQVTNGPCFLKVLIRNTTIETRSTVFHLRENLNNLENYMVEITYNIDNFNLYVTTQVEQLAARGESSSDLLINLFAAYLSVPDRKFVEYVEKQKDKFDEGEDISPKLLMQVALTKFKDRTRSGKWQAPSPEEAQIIALTAQIKDIKANHQAGKGKENAGNGDGNQSGKKKKGSKTKRGEPSDNKYAWKLIAPTSGEPKTKMVNEKEYHFCLNHNDGKGAWVIHNPAKCHAAKGYAGTSNQEPSTNKSLALSKALQAIQDEEDSSSDEE
jgi:hypothetical protein